MKQYVDEAGERQTIVPRVIGQTEAARHAKRRPEGRQWARDSILTDLEAQRGAAAAAVARRIFEWAQERGDLRFWFGSGQKDGSFQAGVDDGEAYLFPFALYTYGRVEVQFQYMLRRAPFDDEERRDEMRKKLNAIPGVEIPQGALNARPSIPLEALATAGALGPFLAVLDWALDQAKAAAS